MAKKKGLMLPSLIKKSIIERAHPQLSLNRQCELLGVSKGSFYYEAVAPDQYNLKLMSIIDEQYLKTPFYGSRKMTEHLERHENRPINRKRVQSLMRAMGIQAIYPKPALSQGRKEHKKYPYLLKGLAIERPNYVWCSDITYIPVRQGFLYLVAVLDWYSRYVLSWRLSNSLDVSFCVEALEEALEKGQPVIFNTDQGSQFTSEEFTETLLSKGIKISMDGRGRVFDNIFIERLWRTIKYEEVYLKGYETVPEAKKGLTIYFSFYNNDRFHETLGYKTPKEIHYRN